ncbi:MAG TPA: type II toxin-antitoxin system death-on-curing family toxin [Bacillales bacterium]|nr:type II toxin-antitoxin system death-on-curing family toxin [Bacillales bacterium]
MEYLRLKDVILLHSLVMKKYGEFENSGVKDMNLLDSAVNRPEQSVFGEDAYPTLELKASALFELIARNHAFYNGNKRTAFAALNVFLKKNGWTLRMPLSDAEEFTVDVAQGLFSIDEMASTIKNHSKPYERR